ncbi:MAG: ADP-ribosylglycohydrolase family protein [Atopobiaceae bacterium]|nr:ADP-ribosylglycohydrolase family protein [Atopobiaceae bacterium]
MRVAPVGLYLSDPDDALQVGAIAAAITHGHPLGFIPAGALAYIVNRLVWGEMTSLAEVVDECVERLPTWFEDEQLAARNMGAQLSHAAKLAASDGSDADNVALLGEGWVGDEALAIAVYAALRHEGDFSKTLIAAINHGGDSDSTGAIAGNIAGAQLGAAGIGCEWTSALELRDVIRRVADELCA